MPLTTLKGKLKNVTKKLKVNRRVYKNKLAMLNKR